MIGRLAQATGRAPAGRFAWATQDSTLVGGDSRPAPSAAELNNILAALLCTLAGLTACDASTFASQPDSTGIRVELAELAPYLTGNTDEAPGDLASLEEIYVGRQYAPLWIRGGAPTPQAVGLNRVMCDAQRYGLRAEEYVDCPGFEKMFAGGSNTVGVPSGDGGASGATGASSATATSDAAAAPSDGASALATAGFDIGLTSAARRFLGHVHFGRIAPSQAGFDLTIARPRLDIGRVLGELSTARDPESIIAQAEPPFEHYKLCARP